MMRSSFPGGLGSFEDQLPDAVQQGQDDHDQDDRESDQNSGQEEELVRSLGDPDRSYDRDNDHRDYSDEHPEGLDHPDEVGTDDLIMVGDFDRTVAMSPSLSF
jgi:hypothetical protein